YNPNVNDRVASPFADLHPRQSYRTTQGVLALGYELEQMLAKITGMDFVSLQPQAGAQSEFTALLVFKAYHAKRGEAATRRRIIVPDSAHGTNPASAAMCGYQVTTVKSDARGNVDLDALKSALGPDVAGFMLTNPNTLGLFEAREAAGLGDSIGTIKQRMGNFGVLVRAYTYMKTLGEEGMVETGRDAILAANYLLALLRPAYDLAYDRPPMHEFVLSASKQKK